MTRNTKNVDMARCTLTKRVFGDLPIGHALTKRQMATAALFALVTYGGHSYALAKAKSVQNARMPATPSSSGEITL
jgi:hypothetical protein